MAKQGIETAKFGRWSAEYLKNIPYQVYYDHGDRQNDPNVFSIKGFYGDYVHNINRLADIDVLIASKDKEAKILIEIEERPISPKKLLGDILAILMCNRIAIGKGKKQEYYEVNDGTKLIVAGILPNHGNRIKKIKEIIKPRLNSMSGFFDGICPENIDLIFKENIPLTINNLKDFVIKFADNEKFKK